MSTPIIFISGPTAIGKSEIALQVALSKNGEIINADSMQVYKELKILTARPTYKDTKIVKHHLYGHISGKYRYNVVKWCNETLLILKKNIKKNKISIIVGGTGLYIQTLLNGIAKIPLVSEEYKKKSNSLFLDLGLNRFYDEVYKIDKKSCEKISRNDSQRLKRIWEVYYSSGKKLSQWIKEKNTKFFTKDDYSIYLFFPSRKEIYDKVNNRFVNMVDRGAINEVKMLLNKNIDKSMPIMKAHGVPEICQYLSGSISLDECISKGQQVTRNYVKRQLTWWKSSKLNNCKIYKDFPINIDLKSLNF